MTEDTKMDLQSMNIAAEKRQQLKQLFPEVFSEDRVDIDALRRVLGDFVEGGKERFGLNWPGKAECMKVIQAPSVATLKPCRDESVNFDDTENLFIEGDNLEVLKLLQKSYFGKIKMIYIDPPYNTGFEFIYPDKYAENLNTYLAYTGQTDDEGKRFSTNTQETGRYHSNWLNMMHPRLYLARNLMQNDGLIFVSIDDNEVENLRSLMNEIFGEENFVDSIVWKKRYGGGAKEKYLVSIHEYILVYAKNIDALMDIHVPLGEDAIERYYKNKDKHYEKRGPYRTHPLEAMKSFDLRANLNFSIPAPDGTEVFPKRQWRWSKERVAIALERDELDFLKNRDGEYVIHTKQYLKNEDGTVRSTKAFSLIDDVYTQHGTNEIVSIFGNAKVFDFPKPSRLIKRLIEIGTEPNEESIILDFFSGSCSSAHAVMEQCSQDNGKRKHIMVQLPEYCDDGSEAQKLGFQTIADIGKERIRRVGNKIQNGADGELNFNRQKNIDIGFKVLKLGRSNFKTWNGDPEAFDETGKQLEMHIDHVDEAASAEDILYELLLKAGFELTTKIETVEFADKEVFSIAEGALLICLEKEITSDLIDAMAEADPFQVICLDEAFHGNDQLKTNAVQTFAARAAAQESEIVFRTV
ncbi:DNA methylase N-4 [Terasakiella brassicae]|uniref:site-specific DNA-methyltransferase (adenine-specific) n=1 Tax=Terasakiella brassicae TaxID=1634917 RepID=A0A917C7B6_9PROT|nr:site-specific DNA-methyltransferase [Terasakiella brassicae]GGF75733.1 DNA methylase N-4 [Terasakiella brassicae]